MSRRVDQNDITRRGAQPNLAGVDGDALIALGLQGIEQERPFERMPRRALTALSASSLPSGRPSVSCSKRPIKVDLP
jgi:hypothetical protein